MTNSLLSHIQSLQFTQKRDAEALTLSFLREVYSADIVAVELRPLAISLNSFNGYLTMQGGQRYFFKTHTEPNTIIQEYYNTELLAISGYPIIKPIFRSADVGKQVLIYELIDDPSVFDMAWVIENGNDASFDLLTKLQNEADDRLFELFLDTLEWLPKPDVKDAPIHQLFYHRLTGGRLNKFYGMESNLNPVYHLGNQLQLFDSIRQRKWQVNGQLYSESIDDVIKRAQHILLPEQDGPTIVGHGDAHNGNVFCIEKSNELTYFDPAFAGRHHPLLDIVKPLFHNVFAMWMYFPKEKAALTTVEARLVDDTIIVNYDYSLPQIRRMFLDSKVDRVLTPILKTLVSKEWLRADWKTFLKAALFCCPLLTMNLLDRDRFPESISILGLAMSIEMGSESFEKRSLIDQILDGVSLQLR
jgi:hypothetical protein